MNARGVPFRATIFSEPIGGFAPDARVFRARRSLVSSSATDRGAEEGRRMCHRLRAHAPKRCIDRYGERCFSARKIDPSKFLAFALALFRELQPLRRDGKNMRLALDVDLPLQRFFKFGRHQYPPFKPLPIPPSSRRPCRIVSKARAANGLS